MPPASDTGFESASHSVSLNEEVEILRFDSRGPLCSSVWDSVLGSALGVFTIVRVSILIYMYIYIRTR